MENCSLESMTVRQTMIIPTEYLQSLFFMNQTLTVTVRKGTGKEVFEVDDSFRAFEQILEF